MITAFNPRTAPAPGHCLVCGTADEVTLRFDVTDYWTGALLICRVCLKYVLTTFEPEYFDMVAGQKYRNLAAQHALAASRAEKFEEASAKFREVFINAVAEYTSELNSLGPSDSGSGESEVRSESAGAESGISGDIAAIDL